MGRKFTMELKMETAEQVKKVLPIIQCDMIGYGVEEDGTPYPEALEDLKETLSGGPDEYRVTPANLKIDDNVLTMHCYPSFDECECGVGADFTQSIAEIFPEFSFTYTSSFEDSTADMYYDEQATLVGGKSFDYSFTESIDCSSSTKTVHGEYANGEWEMNEESEEIETTLFEITCPNCEEGIEITESMLEEGETVCPECGEVVELDPEDFMD